MDAPKGVVMKRALETLIRTWIVLLLLAACVVPAYPQEPAADTVPPRFQDAHEVANQLEAAYPAELAAAGRGGVLGLRIFVNEEGQADTVHIVSSTGYVSLDNAARSVLSRAAYLPARGADGAHADWLDLALGFGEGEPPPDPPIVVGGRTEALDGGLENYPRDLRGTGIQVDVPVRIVVDGTGRVETAVLGTSCFPTADDAARRLTGMLRYETTTGDPHDELLSAATRR
jgi:TonB family protein